MKRFLLFLFYFLTVPYALFWSLNLLLTLSPPKNIDLSRSAHLQNSKKPSQVFAALPQSPGEVAGTVDFQDSRPLIIEKYLRKYKSPMEPYSEIATLIVKVADQYQFDPWLLVAIAQQESNLGKKAPKDCYNPFGWGIHSRGTLCFENWQEGIWTFSRGIKEKYIDKGYTTPEEIMAKYCPNSQGSWAFGVNKFINQLETGDVD